MKKQYDEEVVHSISRLQEALRIVNGEIDFLLSTYGITCSADNCEYKHVETTTMGSSRKEDAIYLNKGVEVAVHVVTPRS